MRKKISGGFTLIEILIVLAVVAALAAVILGTFARVREKARQTSCQSNMKQVYLAIQQYVQDTDARYPISDEWEKGIDPYIQNQQVLRCPSNPLPQIRSATDLSDYYFLRERFNILMVRNPRLLIGAHESSISMPTKSMMLWDKWGGKNTNVPSSCSITSAGARLEFFAAPTVHSAGGNYLFADGHVKWFTPENAGVALCEGDPLQSGFS